MDAEDSRVGVCRSPASCRQEVDELRANVVTFRWKSCDSQSHASHVHRERARAIEEVNAGMLREPDLRYAAALVVARHDEHRDPAVRHARERLERLPRDTRRYPRAIEDITTMDDNVHLARERWRQRCGVVREEVVSATAPLDAGPGRQVETQVGVGEEENSDTAGGQAVHVPKYNAISMDFEGA
jgi:hypothetical protein